MLRKKYLYILSLCIFTTFFSLTSYFIYIINTTTTTTKVTTSTEYNIDIIEHEIKVRAIHLPDEYATKHNINDATLNNFIKNTNGGAISTNTNKNINYKHLWHEFDNEINGNQLFDANNSKIGTIIRALKTAKITSVDNYSKGTQFKLIFQLEGNHLAVFKPQWYDKEKIILGNVYAGKDRYTSEILAFYLGAILDLPVVPIATERIIDVRKELLPFATNLLNSTVFEYKNTTCIYGKCFYCKREDPICSDEKGKLIGAVLYHIPGKLQTYNSPWQRTYKKDKRAVWETQMNYCSTIKTKLSNKRLLDLIDVSIFDFLIQNGDRHHYETLNDKIILIDNGKGLGNPYIHHIDILAPLYQCCTIRNSTWQRLKLLSGGTLTELLTQFNEVKSVISKRHFNAIEERLNIIYATIELCRSRNKFI